MNGNSISIEVLIGLNFKKWKEDFLFGMELADVHIALTKDKPADITTTSIEAEKNGLCYLGKEQSDLLIDNEEIHTRTLKKWFTS